MHEVGLMQEALRIALTHAERNDAARIHALTLRVGQLAGVDMDALRLAFQAVRPDTIADGAVLNLEEMPVRCWCAECHCLFEPANREYRCPKCKRLSAEIRQGREFDVVAVEVS
jgi:hydrogenase nickel incorporation protein HypA/HybF